MKYGIFIAVLLFLMSCRRTFEAPVPDQSWPLFDSSAARSLAPVTRNNLEGVYSISAGAEDFGPLAVVKWNYVLQGADTVWQVSLFCENDITFMICEGKRLDTSILLNGYWRKKAGTETGRVRMVITGSRGGIQLINGQPNSTAVSITGFYGRGTAVPTIPLQLQYRRPLFRGQPFEIVAHRGGGRTSDLLTFSENTVEIIRLSPMLGATGVEIDVRLTKDGIPILYHDNTLNERTIIRNGMVGPIENYTFAQLDALVRLKGGERIPTLQHALETVIRETPLRYVWIDIKYKGSLQPVRNLQVTYLQLAQSLGRNVEITIGIPDEEVFNNFKQLNNYQSIPAVSELSVEKTREINARIWAPQWTLGLQNEAVQGMQQEGRRAFTWTMDIPVNIRQYMQDGRFDGILSNYPSVVAYYYYGQE